MNEKDEKIKQYEKLFDNEMLVHGNRMYFVLVLLYEIVLTINYTIYNYLDEQFESLYLYLLVGSLIFFILNVILISIKKGKLKSYRYIVFLFAIINFADDIYRGYSSRVLFVYVLYILFSLAYLNFKFSLFTSITMCSLYFISIIASVYRGNVLIDVARDNIYMIIVYLFTPIIVVYLVYYLRKKIINYNILKDEKTKEERDFALASKIQEGFLSKDFITNDFYNYYAIMFPAKNVGGDFYDFYDLDDTHKVFLIADVSGKGIPASLLMSSAKNIIHEKIANGLNFSKSLEEANKDIIKINNELQFITLFIAIIDICSGDMYYINAGHCKPIVIKNNGEVDVIKTKSDKFLGAIKKVKYHSNYYKINEGDKLLLYTDGVIERYNDKEELYGIDRLIEFSKNNRNCDAKSLLYNLKNDLDEYAKNAIQNDDITCLAFDFEKYSIKKQSSMKEFDCKKNEMKEMKAFIEEILNKENVPENVKTIFAVVVDEFLSNIVKYAYDEKNEKQYVCIDVLVNNEKVVLKLIDKGKYFNPLNFIDMKITPKVKASDNIGGLGIRLSFNMLDNMHYTREDDKNILTLVKEYE